MKILSLLIANIYIYIMFSYGNNSFNILNWQEIINIYNLYPGWYSDMQLFIGIELFIIVLIHIIYRKLC